MSGKTNTLDMTQGRPTMLMLRFAIPMMIGSIFQSLYSLVDSSVLGRYVGPQALAAIGASGSTVNFLLLLATGATSAISIVISQYFGSGSRERIRAGLSASMYLALTLGIGLGLIGIFAARPMLRLLDTPADIIDQSVVYIRIICGLCIAQFAYNASASVLRALGDSRTPLIFLIICSVLNVILDLIAVLALNMEVAGVAAATVASQAVSAVICIIYMFRKYPMLKLTKTDLKPDVKALKQIGSLGAQMALQSGFLSIGMMVITRVINGYGSDVVAAFTVGSGVQGLAVMLFSNFAFGFSVYVGQNFGAKRTDRISKGLKEMLILVGGLTLISCALSQIFAKQLVNIYIKSEELTVMEASLSFVRIQACFFPFLGWIWLYNSVLRGMGKVSVTMISSFVELGSKIGFSLILPIFMGYTGIWYSAPLGWILGIVPSAIYYYSGRWKSSMEKAG